MTLILLEVFDQKTVDSLEQSRQAACDTSTNFQCTYSSQFSTSRQAPDFTFDTCLPTMNLPNTMKDMVSRCKFRKKQTTNDKGSVKLDMYIWSLSVSRNQNCWIPFRLPLYTKISVSSTSGLKLGGMASILDCSPILGVGSLAIHQRLRGVIQVACQLGIAALL